MYLLDCTFFFFSLYPFSPVKRTNPTVIMEIVRVGHLELKLKYMQIYSDNSFGVQQYESAD
jgi:hypothetical protein